MLTRITLVALALVAGPSLAQAPAAPPPAEDVVNVALDTEKGRIVIALDRGRARLTAANFLRYVDSGKYDGETFYRAMPYGKGGLIQGGIRSDARKLLPPVEHEPTSQTGLKNVAGAVSMARLAPGTAQADFFVLTTDIPAFDASAADPGFAVFGKVIEGMDVVRAILTSPVSPTRGEGVMKGQLLEPAIRITKASRLP